MLASAPLALADDCNHLTATLLQSAIDQGWSIDQDWLKTNRCDHGTVGSYNDKKVIMKATGLYAPSDTSSSTDPRSKPQRTYSIKTTAPRPRATSR
jgi:hypothetical protein